MKPLAWNEEKNQWLKRERGISFEEIAIAINTFGLIADIKHPNKEKYSNQHVMIIKMKGYVYVVPYVENQEQRFLKTIYPSRNAKKKYVLKKGVL